MVAAGGRSGWADWVVWLGLTVRMRVAVPPEGPAKVRVMVAAVSEVVEVELDCRMDCELLDWMRDCELAAGGAWRVDGVMVGSTVTVTVPKPEVVTRTTEVRVLWPDLECEVRLVAAEEATAVETTDEGAGIPVTVEEPEAKVAEPEVDVVEAKVDVAEPEVDVAEPADDADADADELGTMASGTVPRTFLASAISVQPRITPSVVSMGIAKQAVPGSPQGTRSKPAPLAQVASPPATQAVWPVLQADCLVRVAKRSLNSRACCTLFW